MRKKTIFLLYILVPFLAWSHPNIEKIPAKDREILETFFDYLIHNSIIGYSLCGDKPASIETLPILSKIPIQYAVKIFAKKQGYSILQNGIKTWSEYSYLFPSKNFVFRFVSEYNTIVLINKKEALRVIEENLDLFQKYTHSKQISTEFLKEVCYPKDRDYLIQYNRALLGILLGFGRNNSLAFTKRNYLQKLENFKLYNTNDSLNSVMNPGFLVVANGTNEEENDKIREICRRAKQKIGASFRKGFYFETFVDLFTN
jgi:hypothetical protein